MSLYAVRATAVVARALNARADGQSRFAEGELSFRE
jgi:hypothetical protein